MSGKRALNRAVALAAALLMITALFPAGSFADSATGHWSEPWIRDAQDLNWIPNRLGASFDVDLPVTRAEMAVVVWQAMGMPEAEGDLPFSDVGAGTYNAAALTYLNEAGVVEGYGEGLAAPDDNVTREMMFTVLARMFALTADDPAACEVFADAVDIDEWAREPISALYEAGIVEGDESRNVNPLDGITFAELVKVLAAANDSTGAGADNPLTANPNEPVSPNNGGMTYTPAAGGDGTDTTEIAPDEDTPLGAAEVPEPLPPVYTSGGSPAPVTPVTPVTPVPVFERRVAVVYSDLFDETLIQIDASANVTAVSLTIGGTPVTVARGEPSAVYAGGYEWRAHYPGSVPLAEVSGGITLA